MNSRLEKYHYEEENTEIPSRVAKNQELYNTISMPSFDNMKPNDNVTFLETTSNKIDIDKIKRYVEVNSENEDKPKNIVVKDDIEVLPADDTIEDDKVYDINSILETAKENKEAYYEDEKHKKLRDTQYDILSKINIEPEESEEEVKEEKTSFTTEEQTLMDLINTVTKNKEDLFGELKGDDSTMVTSPIAEEEKDDFISNAIIDSTLSNTKEEEKTNEDSVEIKELDDQSVKNLDQSFYTNSMTFSKEDFEGFEELEKKVKKNSAFVKVSIAILIILVLSTIFIVLKYVLNLF